MRYRPFGNTGFKVSEVSLGCWQLGADWGDVSGEEADAILKTAVDNGINFFDTADVYGAGRSEAIIGKFLKSQNKKIFVATKIGRFSPPGWPENFTLDAVRTHVMNCKKRLQVGCLDLVQLHCIPAGEMKKGLVFEHLRALQQEHHIRFWGASVESVDEGFLCLQQQGICSLQIIYNLFRQKPESLIKEANRKGVAVIVRLPLASGLLAGKFSPSSSFPLHDHRNYNQDGQRFNVGETFAGIPFPKAVVLAEQIKPILEETAGSQNPAMAQRSLRWILDNADVTTIIPGATKSHQVRENILASSLAPLTEGTHRKLNSFYKEKVECLIRGPY
ncbi:aldo/keto reductase [Candidatus Woesearchaeota archaeon]|nr:aldo/keto reductase [Candidatus Woesearchaeota archaeon]